MNLITTRSKTLLFAAMLVCAATQSVHADFYLNGGIATMISPLGNGASFGGAAEYDSFNTVNAPLFFNNATETSQLLSVGTQSFSVTGHGGSANAFRGLALFFTPSATQLSPVTDFSRAPDLYVYTNGSTFQFGAAGIDVVTLGAFSPYAAYSGATSFSIGLETVTVSGWDGDTLTLTLTAVPEPSSLVLISLTLFGISFRRSKRSKAH